MSEEDVEQCVLPVEEEHGGEWDLPEGVQLPLEEIPYWMEELQDEVKHNISQFHELSELNERLGIILKNIEKPLEISLENQAKLKAHRGSEVGAQDIVDQALRKETEVFQRSHKLVTNEMERVNFYLAQIRDVRFEIEVAIDKIANVKDRDDCVKVLSALSKEIGPVEIPNPVSLNHPPLLHLEHLRDILDKSRIERNMAQFLSTDITRDMLRVANECFGIWYSTNAAFKVGILTKSQAKDQVERNVQKLDQDIQTLKSHMEEVEIACAAKTALFEEARRGLDSRKEQSGLELCRDPDMMYFLREMKVQRNVVDILAKKSKELESTLEHLLKTKRTLGRDLKLKCIGISDQEKCLSLRQSFPISTFKEARTPKPFSAQSQ